MTLSLEDGASKLVRVCARVAPGETVAVVYDAGRPESVADAIVAAASKHGAGSAYKLTVPTGVSGSDLPPAAAEAVLGADVVFGVTSRSVAHTSAGREAARRGARIVSLTGCTEDTLRVGGIEADFEAEATRCKRLAVLLSEGRLIEMVTARGTSLTADLSGRTAVANTAVFDESGLLGGCPNIEAYIAPVEGSAEGTLVADASGTDLGLLEDPIRLRFEHGSAVSIAGGRQAETFLALVERAGPKARVLAEIGIGLNPSARVIGSIIEDEGAYGTAHCALGSNESFGGRNAVAFHVDLVFWRPTITIDGSVVMHEGKATFS